MSLKTKEKIFMAITVLAMIAAITAILVVTYRVHSVGTIKAIGIDFFQDQACTTKLTQIDWGVLAPGTTRTFVGYCKNTKTVPVTLNFTTDNWSPTNAAQYITGSWNYTGQVINPGQVLPVQFSVDVASNITDITSFSFDYVVTATEKT